MNGMNPSESAVRHIVVIDDVASNLTLFSKVIGQIGDCSAVCFGNGRDALAWLEQNDAALIVVDQNMAEISGLEFIESYRGRGPKNVPIIMVTGFADRDLARDAYKRGASAFLGKPVDPSSFISLARNLIELHSSQSSAEATEPASVDLNEDVATSELATIDAFARTIERRDRALGEHGQRVALFSEAIGRRLGLSLVELTTLRTAARIHDLGKVVLPDRVLFKTTRLVGEERELAKRHVVEGAAILAGFRGPTMRAAAEIARAHHERFDGSGYPANLQGAAIPRFARIVAVADTFSALTSDRPWRAPVSVGLAVEQITRDSGLGFEPRIVTAFREALDEILKIRAELPGSDYSAT